jgi:hypothetical protein
MTSPRELVTEIAKQTGVPEGTVVQHDRNLAVAGLRSVGGRGRAVAQVTYSDATNLLIAVAGSPNVKDSVKIVQTYSALTSSNALMSGIIERGHTFGEALATLLKAAPSNGEIYADVDRDLIEVSLFGPAPSARIEWDAQGSKGRVEYRNDNEGPFADLQFIAKFSQVTLRKLGQLLSK